MTAKPNEKKEKEKWFFNDLMVWGAVLGIAFFWGLQELHKTWVHEGPGVHLVHDEPEWINEKAYKRMHYGYSGMTLIASFFLWRHVAKFSHLEKREKAAFRAKANLDVQRGFVLRGEMCRVFGARPYNELEGKAKESEAYQKAERATQEIEAEHRAICEMQAKMRKND